MPAWVLHCVTQRAVRSVSSVSSESQQEGLQFVAVRSDHHQTSPWPDWQCSVTQYHTRPQPPGILSKTNWYVVWYVLCGVVWCDMFGVVCGVSYVWCGMWCVVCMVWCVVLCTFECWFCCREWTWGFICCCTRLTLSVSWSLVDWEDVDTAQQRARVEPVE